jgi:nitrous oxide reductase accessory protein NosL
MVMMPMTGVLGSYPMTQDVSGTSWQPSAATHEGIHAMAGSWMLMGHGNLFGIYDTQSGPRGDDKAFLAGMLMGMARRDFGVADTLNLRLMLSPDPFMGKDGYPLLLQSGETADGQTHLIDRQHPHDFISELSASFTHRFSDADSVFLYAGYPGEPALGPTAYPHRASAMDNPATPIGHHWLDSTHIVFGVVTVGFVHEAWKIEVSQFTGREPDQHRFDFDAATFDSTAVRLTWNPSAHWSFQTSWGYLKSPEQLHPETDESRVTASATYVHAFGKAGSLAATLAWGFRHESDGPDLNEVLLEGEYKPNEPWTFFARGEWQQNSELDDAGRVKAVAALTLGGIHDWRVAEHLKLGLGALYTFDFVPSSITPSYGGDPHGIMVFLRLGIG